MGKKRAYKGKKDSKENTPLAFSIPMPAWLTSQYDKLQTHLDEITADEDTMTAIDGLDLTDLKAGDAWAAIHAIIKPHIDTWNDINNRAWFARMIENQLLDIWNSRAETHAIRQALLANSLKINQAFWDAINQTTHRPTRAEVENVLRAVKKENTPGHEYHYMPRSIRFLMDYSISDKQMFKMTQYGTCQYKIGNDWHTQQILIPMHVRPEATGIISKPRYVKKDGKYIGHVTYAVKKNAPTGDNIMGVDLNRSDNRWTACILHKDGTRTDPFYINSTRTAWLDKKLSQKYDAKQRILAKLDRILPRLRLSLDDAKTMAEKPFADSGLPRHAWLLLRNVAGVCGAINRLKTVEMPRVMANEIVMLAVEHGCSVIRLELLSWVGPRGGKWEHSLIQQAIERRARVDGVRVVRVNPAYTSTAHPGTGARGRERGRDVVFSDGFVMNRDCCSAMNTGAGGALPDPVVVRRVRARERYERRMARRGNDGASRRRGRGAGKRGDVGKGKTKGKKPGSSRTVKVRRSGRSGVSPVSMHVRFSRRSRRAALRALLAVVCSDANGGVPIVASLPDLAGGGLRFAVWVRPSGDDCWEEYQVESDKRCCTGSNAQMAPPDTAWHMN